jgi:hypothetical protein
VTPEPPAPSLVVAVERLGTALQAFSIAGAETLAASKAIESGADVPRLRSALDELAARVVEVQRAVVAYQGLAHLAEAGWRQRQRLQN